MQIKEYHLDTFGHVNHATYLVLLEQARWEICNQYEMGISYIQKKGIGPVILSAQIDYKSELRVRDKIQIFTDFTPHKSKLFYVDHEIQKESGELAAKAKLLAAIWDVRERKIISPPVDWARILS